MAADQAPRPWDSPGKNTGVECHFLLQGMKVKSESEVAQSCPTLLDPMDCSLPGSSIHGIFWARVLEWVAIAFSGETVWRFLKKLKIESPNIPGQRKWKQDVEKLCTPMFIAAWFTTAKIWKQTSVHQWMGKDVVYVYIMEYYSTMWSKSCFVTT